MAISHADRMAPVTDAAAGTPLPLIYPASRLRLRTLIFIRWIAVIGQVLAIAVVQAGLNFDVPLVPALAAVGGLAALNLITALQHRGATWLSDRPARLYLACDLLQLLVLLAMTGGLQNPFAVLILAPVVVSAATLSRRSTILLAALAIGGIAVLAYLHLPLPWDDQGLQLPRIYIAGILAALVLAVAFTASYVSSLALESRRLADALGATQLALAREQQLSALGALAAAAAHELGSPLATIAVVARELERELPEDTPEDHPLREDIALLREEAERCRRILTELANRPVCRKIFGHIFISFSALVEAAAHPYAGNGVSLQIEYQGAPNEQPLVPRMPEMLHGLGMLLQNALQFAQSRVEVELSWTDRQAHIVIRDDGPGFDEGILGDLGEPYVSTGNRGRQASTYMNTSGEAGEHMGLGIFIARNLLAQANATVAFQNRSGGGAEVAIVWPLGDRRTRSNAA